MSYSHHVSDASIVAIDLVALVNQFVVVVAIAIVVVAVTMRMLMNLMLMWNSLQSTYSYFVAANEN